MTVVNFPGSNWRKSTSKIAATGRTIVSWETVNAGRRACIFDDDGYWWRAYRPILHRKPTSRQRYRPLTDWMQAESISAAMASAESHIAV
ncbi:hypothetical protein [Tardiphaga robiniae]|uniref:hypothetical protein n=1 Tax=Tardiphaga robiniae TaxID=943830 RepID=UPI00111284F4|nr:hypothetical protein [Tardiphaga robiniae]